MSKEKSTEYIDEELINDIGDNIIKIFSTNKEYLTKNDCKQILNIIFEALFDEKLKNKNFEYIFKLLSSTSDNIITKNNMYPIVKALIVCFDVNYITNSNSFNDKICIKIGKYLLPGSYYIKKND
jgi:uncharacterized membrane protein YheB (UPF0754 family)